MIARWMLLVVTAISSGCSRSADRVVLYCAQDREFAETLFEDFQAQTRLTLIPKFDTEANKSVSLASELLAERSRARCDVHWNNEILNTIRLARQNVYEPFIPAQSLEYPDWTKSRDQTWYAFAARARVLIVNNNLVKAEDRPTSLLDLTQPRWRGKVAMAKPLFGTTATHAACLFVALGAEPARQFYRQLKANDVNIVSGNKQVAVGVAKGDFAIGMTDTDDALIEQNAGKPVTILYPDREPNPSHPRLGVLYIPNTIALVKGGPNLEGGRKLIEYLLRAETEKRLAEGGGFQIPLNPKVIVDRQRIPGPETVKRMEVDFEQAADCWDDVQAFLREEFSR